MIGGNTILELQRKTAAKNAIGEAVEAWETAQSLTGWLDYSSGESPRTSFNSKIQESTHFFIGDYVAVEVKPEECRAVCNGEVYDVLIIDNPMGMNRQIEIYLKYTGAQ